MIKDNNEKAYSQGFNVDCEYSDVYEKSVLTNAKMKVGQRNTETGKCRHSHNEPVNVDYLNPRGKEIIGEMDALARELWEIMKDPEQYGEHNQ